METWAGIVIAAIGAVLVFVAALHVFMTTTAERLHPDPAAVPSRPAAEPSPDWTRAVTRGRALLRAALSERNLPGLSVAVGVGGDVVWAEGFGWANLERRTPVTPSTRFRIGTASTVLTSAAAALLVERGVLKLDDEIQAYVPGFPRKEWRVTLRDVMTHQAGIVPGGGDESALYGQHCERAAEALPEFAERPLMFEPGTAYSFSNFGWILVSAAIESATRESLPAFMRREVFGPLGMTDTTDDISTGRAPHAAAPYFPRYAANPTHGLHGLRPVDYTCYAGASVFVSTPTDLVRFGLAMNEGTLLAPATRDAFQASQRLRSGEETGYGLGWDVETPSIAGVPTRVVGHDGDALGGQVASLMLVRERDLVVAVTSNISYADTASVAQAVASAFVELAPAR